MKISLGTTSKQKKYFVEKVFKSNNFPFDQIISSEVSSGVGDQPLSELETKTGAHNRAMNALNGYPDCDMGIGLEGGLHKIDNSYHLVCCACIYLKDNSVFFGISQYAPLPKIVSVKVEEGNQFGDSIREYYEEVKKECDDGLVGYIDSLISREPYFRQALEIALLQFKFKNFFR